MPARLMESLGTTEPLAEIFADPSVVCAMLEFEAALVRAQARLRIIPAQAAKIIAATAAAGFEARILSQLVRAVPSSATPGVPLVQALREQVRKKNPAAAGFVHWGA